MNKVRDEIAIIGDDPQQNEEKNSTFAENLKKKA